MHERYEYIIFLKLFENNSRNNFVFLKKKLKKLKNASKNINTPKSWFNELALSDTFFSLNQIEFTISSKVV